MGRITQFASVPLIFCCCEVITAIISTILILLYKYTLAKYYVLGTCITFYRFRNKDILGGIPHTSYFDT